ncbi:leucine-rich repeat domain-containing protein, partial [Klebsiella pneumoniae]|nr:leucine-rich repeat domain-containing protein [Klebsiella pneumoniae]
ESTNLSSVIIGSGLTNVGEGIFGAEGNSSVCSVTLRDGLSTIPERIFMDSSALTSITIPNSVVSIGNTAFYGCSSLSSITIPNSVMSIGE